MTVDSGKVDRSPGQWAVHAASVTGSGHRRRGEPGQDRASWKTFPDPRTGSQLLAIVTADGAGSARKSWAGAWFVCRSIMNQIGRMHERHVTDDPPVHASDAWSELRLTRILDIAGFGIRRWSLRINARPDDLAATVNVAIVGDDFARFVQIGDGLMGFRGPELEDGWEMALEPASGEFAGETWFLTSDDWKAHAQFRLVDRPVRQVIVSSDGLAPILFDARRRAFHEPFVDPLVSALQHHSDAPNTPVDDRLARFLASERVGLACDDDLTLVIALRTATGTVDESGPPG